MPIAISTWCWTISAAGGRSWRESDEERTDRATVLQDLLEGQYNNPVRVIAFNTAEGWSRDVSADIAHELAQLAAKRDEKLSASIEDFLDLHLARAGA